MSSFESTIGEVMALGPGGVRDWLNALKSGKTELPAGWNLLGLAQSAGLQAREDLDLEWLRAAVEIYEYLAQREGGRRAAAHLLSANLLRTYFIAQMGVLAAERLLDLDEIVAWFLNATDLSTQEAAARSANWTALEPREILRLRDIKNNLAVFDRLKGTDLLAPYPGVREWLAIRNQLP